jgi:DNA invertase Pin-like site-specific DNA recombinase
VLPTNLPSALRHLDNDQLDRLLAAAHAERQARRLISERTRAALAEAKKRGRKLGANGAKLAVINKRLADEFAASISQTVLEIGLDKSYCEIARRLNEGGLQTRTGKRFYAQSVKNIALRMPMCIAHG